MPIRIKSVEISAKFTEPKFGAATVMLDCDGIDVPVTLPLKQGEGAPSGFAQVERIFREAADAMAVKAQEFAQRHREGEA